MHPTVAQYYNLLDKHSLSNIALQDKTSHYQQACDSTINIIIEFLQLDIIFYQQQYLRLGSPDDSSALSEVTRTNSGMDDGPEAG